MNYRGLNATIIKNRYLLFLINKISDRLVNTKIFIKFNLKTIYYYIYIKNNNI
jgi:hypothetical protein